MCKPPSPSSHRLLRMPGVGWKGGIHVVFTVFMPLFWFPSVCVPILSLFGYFLQDTFNATKF